MAGWLAGLASALVLTGCSVVGIRSGTEEPRFDVVGRVGEVEIRRYGPLLAAETVVAGDAEAARSAGFRRLAGYIFGANHDGGKIAMTAPVAQSAARIAMTAPVAARPAGDGGFLVRFFLPAGYTAETVPAPNDPAVAIVTVPGETMAVYRFSGSISPAAMARGRARLLRRLEGSDWRQAGEPVDFFYDPPWTLPPLRRNEVAVPVVAAGG